MVDKRRYRRVLRPNVSTEQQPLGSGMRRPAAQDTDVLAGLMLDAYRGTIDYEGESVEDAVAEVAEFFVAGWPEQSIILFDRTTAASAVLVSLTEVDGPLIRSVMTAPRYKNQGLAHVLVSRVVNDLARSGAESVTAYITEGNEPSEKVFKSLGFVLTE